MSRRYLIPLLVACASLLLVAAAADPFFGDGYSPIALRQPDGGSTPWSATATGLPYVIPVGPDGGALTQPVSQSAAAWRVQGQDGGYPVEIWGTVTASQGTPAYRVEGADGGVQVAVSAAQLPTTLSSNRLRVSVEDPAVCLDATLTGGTLKAISRGGAKGDTVAADVTSTSIDANHQGLDIVATGTVTSNIGTTGGLCLDATLTGGTQKAIARGGAKGDTVAADITSTSVDANHQGLDVVVGSGTVTVSSGTVTANIGTSGALALDATLTGGTQKSIARGGAKGETTAADVTSSSVDANHQGLDVVATGTVTANVGTTGGICLDATLTGGTQKAIARGGAKGSTVAADITSTSVDADHQGLDVVATGTVAVSSGTVTANIGTSGSLALDATLTGGTQKAIARGGAKGSTVAADVTSTSVDADHQGLDVVASGTVTANVGTTGGICLDATLTGGTQKAISRGGAKGATVAADITSTSIDADHQGLDVVVGSGAVTVSSGTVTANVGTTGGICLDATLTGGTQKAIARGGAKGATVAADLTSTSIDADHQGLDVVVGSGTVTANIGTSGSLALDATLTGGTAKSIARGGAKGSTVAADLTSTSIDANHQGLDVVVGSGAVTVSSGTVTANIGTSGSLALDATLTGGTAKALVNPAAQTSSAVTEVLVLNSASTATPASPLSGRRFIDIMNLGPNAIFCRTDGVAAVVNKAHRINTNESWPLACDTTACNVACIAATADQVTTAATIVTELK